MSLPPVPPGVHRVVRRHADGSVKAVYHYHRTTGAKLPAPDDPAFPAAFAAASREKIKPARTIADLIVEYKRSPGYLNLRPSSRREYNRALGEVGGKVGEVAIGDVRRGHVMQVRDAMAGTPSRANKFVMLFGILMRFAVDREYRETNPADRIARVALGEHRRWTDADLAYALEHLPERFRRAMVLALYTGQRASDVVAMAWSDFDGTGIRVAQVKTGARLWIPVHAELRRELALWKQDMPALTILTSERGRPWPAKSFSCGFSQELRANHRRLDGLVFHGLRKTAAARLAEAGCTLHEIAAITGHRALSMIELYTREAEQKVNAEAAIVKLETRAETRGN